MVLYNLVIRCYALLIRLASFRNPKARKWVAGRKGWKKQLEKKLIQLGTGERIWMHCASYGEFEQGRPLLEALREQHRECKLVLTFFSPSGYEAFKDWSGADLICYLPFDSKRNAKDFLELAKPSKAIFIKYEFWLNFLFELKRLAIPTYLVSAVFKPHHPFFKWYGALFRKSLQTYTRIFVQDQISLKRLGAIGVKQASLVGDTRFDRVLDIRKNFVPIPFFESFCKGHPILVAGSTWPKDEELLLEVFKTIATPGLKLILVPHEVDPASIEECKKRIRASGQSFVSYSEVIKEVDSSRFDERVLLLDAMGLLSKLYHYADVAYVGGGFDTGIHNLLEPSVHLKPVIFAGEKNYSLYNEALELIRRGAAKPVNTVDELRKALLFYLENAAELERIKTGIETYFKESSGSAEKVMNHMFR